MTDELDLDAMLSLTRGDVRVNRRMVHVLVAEVRRLRAEVDRLRPIRAQFHPDVDEDELDVSE